MLMAVEGPYALMVQPDDILISPREVDEHFGTMVCFHSRYALGDSHNYMDKDDFLREMYLDTVGHSVIAAVLRKMEQERTTPKVGRNSMKRLTYKDPGANTIEVSGRIRSFERYARKHQVRYHIEKELGTDPPKWTVYFKANQADALTAAFKEYTRKDLTRSTRPSLLSQLHKFKELAQALGRDRVKNKEHGGPER